MTLGPEPKIIDDLVVKSKAACSNHGRWLFDFMGDTAYISSLSAPYEEMKTVKSKTNRILEIFGLSDVNVFGIMGSKNADDLLFVSGDDLSLIDNNASTTMKGLTIHSMRMLEGGSRARKFILVDHDDQEHSIYEYKMADERRRDWMVFALVQTIDLNYRAVSNLINENKLLCHDTINDKYLVFNFDMKVYWKVDEQLQKCIDESDDAEMNFVPESHEDGLITKTDGHLTLKHHF